MVQFNLLPDVKVQYLKAKRQKHVVVLISVVSVAACLVVLFVLISTVMVVQKKHLSDLNKDIKSVSKKLEQTDDLTKILTVQNQLKSLTALHDKKPVVSRLSGYMTQIIPSKASVSVLQVDFEVNNITINGSADNLSVVNTLADTLKFTDLTVNDKLKGKAFSEVVLTSFSKGDKTTTYVISLKFDPAIFDGTVTPKLVIPDTITTRSQSEQPSALFKKSTDTELGS